MILPNQNYSPLEISSYMGPELTQKIYSPIDSFDAETVLNQSKDFTKIILQEVINSTRTGSAHEQAGISMQRFLSGLFMSSLYLLAQILIFLFLRVKYKNLYQANKILYPGEFKKNWISQVWQRDSSCYEKNGDIDGFLFLRFLKFLSFFFFTVSLLNVPILIPIHYRSSDKQILFSLDKLNMSNVSSNRMIIHLILGIFVVVWFHILLLSEFKYVSVVSRKTHLKNKYRNVVFLDNVELLNPNNERILQSFGKIKDTCLLSKRYYNFYNTWKKMYMIEKNLEKVILVIVLEKFYFHSTPQPFSKNNCRTQTFVQRHINNMKYKKNKLCYCIKTMRGRIKIRLKFTSIKVSSWLSLPTIKVNRVPFLKNEYRNLEKLLDLYIQTIKLLKDKKTGVQWDNKMDSYNKYEWFNKVFICFESYEASHMCSHLLKSTDINEHRSLIIGPNPRDIIWLNLVHNSTIVGMIRSIVANLLSVSIIIGWVLPVALIGIIAQIPYLTTLLLIPSKIDEIPSDMLRNMLTSIIPVITLVFLTECVPYIFRLLSYLKGCRTGAEIEKDTQNWFFVFLFVHLFIVVTLSSGISSIIENLVNNPTSVPTLLAHELPKSSNFFCSFILIRGMAYFGGNLIRIKELFLEVFYYKMRIYTPHVRFRRLHNSLFFQWGSIYPLFSVLGCIGIIYSIISPIILPFCCISFMLVYLSFKYLFEYQYNTGNVSDTFGKLYPKSLLQLYAGIYFMEFCLLGLFTLSNEYMLATCIGVVFVSTVICHHRISKEYVSNLHCLSLNSKGDSGKHSNSSETLYGDLDSFRFPKVNFDRNYKELWIPNDNLGIVEDEIVDIQKSYGINFNTKKFVIDPCGEIRLG